MMLLIHKINNNLLIKIQAINSNRCPHQACHLLQIWCLHQIWCHHLLTWCLLHQQCNNKLILLMKMMIYTLKENYSKEEQIGEQKEEKMWTHYLEIQMRRLTSTNQLQIKTLQHNLLSLKTINQSSKMVYLEVQI